MEIKEFVSQTIIEIIDGIRLAQEYARANGGVVNAGNMVQRKDEKTGLYDYGQGHPQQIEFDLQVIEHESAESRTGIAVFFAPVSAGISGKQNAALSSANRIHFSVPVAFPKQK